MRSLRSVTILIVSMLVVNCNIFCMSAKKAPAGSPAVSDRASLEVSFINFNTKRLAFRKTLTAQLKESNNKKVFNPDKLHTFVGACFAGLPSLALREILFKFTKMSSSAFKRYWVSGALVSDISVDTLAYCAAVIDVLQTFYTDIRFIEGGRMRQDFVGIALPNYPDIFNDIDTAYIYAFYCSKIMIAAMKEKRLEDALRYISGKYGPEDSRSDFDASITYALGAESWSLKNQFIKNRATFYDCCGKMGGTDYVVSEDFAAACREISEADAKPEVAARTPAQDRLTEDTVDAAPLGDMRSLAHALPAGDDRAQAREVKKAVTGGAATAPAAPSVAGALVFVPDTDDSVVTPDAFGISGKILAKIRKLSKLSDAALVAQLKRDKTNILALGTGDLEAFLDLNLEYQDSKCFEYTREKYYNRTAAPEVFTYYRNPQKGNAEIDPVADFLAKRGRPAGYDPNLKKKTEGRILYVGRILEDFKLYQPAVVQIDSERGQYAEDHNATNYSDT